MASTNEETMLVTSSRNHHVPLTIAVEGNIGSGKSTFLSFCEIDNRVETLYEPVDRWTDVNGFNLLVSVMIMALGQS